LGYEIRKKTSILAVATTAKMKHLSITTEKVSLILTNFKLYDEETDYDEY
jgi:hypothetical protein